MCIILIKLKLVMIDNKFKIKQLFDVFILYVLGILIKCYIMRYMYSKYIIVNDMLVVMYIFDDFDNFFFLYFEFCFESIFIF